MIRIKGRGFTNLGSTSGKDVLAEGLCFGSLPIKAVHASQETVAPVLRPFFSCTRLVGGS